MEPVFSIASSNAKKRASSRPASFSSLLNSDESAMIDSRALAIDRCLEQRTYASFARRERRGIQFRLQRAAHDVAAFAAAQVDLADHLAVLDDKGDIGERKHIVDIVRDHHDGHLPAPEHIG